MYDLWHSAAKNGVCTIFGTVPHAVMSAITSYNYGVFTSFQVIQQLSLVLFPVQQNSREQLSLQWKLHMACYLVAIQASVLLCRQVHSLQDEVHVWIYLELVEHLLVGA